MSGCDWVEPHLTEVVLPWWEANGADDEQGGVWSCFSNDGRRLSTEKYTWSQGRWAWLCAELADEAEQGRLPIDADRWRRRAVRTAEFLTTHAVRDDGRTWFRTDTDGHGLADPGTDPAASVFADLFAVLGLAGAHRWAPDAGFGEVASTVLSTAEQAIGARTATMAPYPVRDGFDDLATAMTLLHTGSELGRLTGAPFGFEVARRAAERLVRHHLRDDDWAEYRAHSATDADTLLARHRTPGHLLECLWMLVHACDADPDLVVDLDLGSLAVRALDLGTDAEFGGLLRYADTDGGRPRGRVFGDDPYERLVQATWDTKLWWVHAEALYASALLAVRDVRRRSELIDRYERLRYWTRHTFPDPGGAEWIQIRDRRGDPLDQVVALPVKDPFHIARSLLLLHRLEYADANCTPDLYQGVSR